MFLELSEIENNISIGDQMLIDKPKSKKTKKNKKIKQIDSILEKSLTLFNIFYLISQY